MRKSKKWHYNRKRISRWYSENLIDARKGDEAAQAYCQAVYELNVLLKLRLELEDWDNEWI